MTFPHLSEPSGWETQVPPGCCLLPQRRRTPQRTPRGRTVGPEFPEPLMALPLSSQGKIADPFRFTTFYVSFALLLFALILSCFREKPPFFSPKNVNPVSFPWKLDGSGGSTAHASAQPLPAAPFPSSSFHPHVICATGAWGRKEQGLPLPLLCFERLLPVLPSHLLESLPGTQCRLPLPPVFLVVHKVSWLFLLPGPEGGGKGR